MAIKFERSPYGEEAGSTRRRWPSRRGTAPTLTREDIQRDAAAQLGVPVDLLDPSADPTRDTPATPAAPAARRPRRDIAAWVRELVSPEPADVRRQRIEAEAEAELGLANQPGPEQAG